MNLQDIEQVVTAAPAMTAPVGDWLKWVGAILVPVLAGGAGYIYKNKRNTGVELESTSDTITRESLVSARARQAELEAQNRALYAQLAESSTQQIQAEGRAERASIQAALSAEAAERAHVAANQALAAAAAAQTEAAESNRRLPILQAYVRTLREAMIAAGMNPPPEPA